MKAKYGGRFMLFMMIVKASKNTKNSQSSTEWGMIHP
jgi:hypothetical protein